MFLYCNRSRGLFNFEEQASGGAGCLNRCDPRYAQTYKLSRSFSTPLSSSKLMEWNAENTWRDGTLQDEGTLG